MRCHDCKYNTQFDDGLLTTCDDGVTRCAPCAANETTDIDTYTRIDYAIHLLEGDMRLTPRERRDIALLLRRWRKQRYGSALTHTEKAEGRAEVNP